MNEIDVSTEDFRKLLEKGESHFLDFKDKRLDGVGIQKIAVAFANADGGDFFLGIKDQKDAATEIDRWDGFASQEDANAALQNIFSLNPTVTARYEFWQAEFGSGFVLRVSITKSGDVAKATNGKVFQRQGAQSLTVSDPDKIQQLAFAKGAVSFEDQIVTGLPPDPIVEGAPLANFLVDFSPRTDALSYVVSENLVDYESWKPRISAALLFHENPSAVVPRKCAIKISRYRTREDDPEREHLTDVFSVEGPLYSLIHKAIGEVTRIMSEVKVWTTEGMKSLQYPKEAIWETVANAVIHRDYSISDDIQIRVFENRIEILSPGRLPGYVTLSNILDARFSRNTKIVRTLARYKDAPNRDLGEGLNTAFQKMKEFGLREPIIEEDANYLKVTLPHTPLATPGEAILKFLASNDSIANAQARDITGIKSENAVKQEFYKLRDAGFIEPVPGLKGRNSAWRKPKL